MARVQAAAPPPGDGGQDGGQNGGMEEADWPFPDWPIADVTSGGGTLSWSPSDIYNRIRAIDARRDFGNFATAEVENAVLCTGGFSDRASCNVEYSSVMTHLHGGIPIVRARALLGSGVDGRPPREEIGVGGILEYGYFMVAWERENIGSDFEDEASEARFVETWHYDSRRSSTLDDDLTTGRWQGAMIGTGRNATSLLYRQFIVGDVDITVRPRGSSSRFVDIEFDNIRNLSTGDRNVTLSHMRWEDLITFNSLKTSSQGSLLSPGHIRIHFLGPNDEEVLGVFHTEEAVGGFGAKKP